MSALCLPSAYEPNLPALELDRVISGLLAAQRRAEWLLCRYLADIASDQRFRALGWYADVLHYARARFGLGVKSTRERLRIGRALRTLPAIEQAFVRGELCYSRVRELTRVATPETEPHWLALGRLLGMRELERRVAAAVGPKAGSDEPANVRWKSPETVEVKLTMPADGWALVERAMEGARHAAERPLSDAEALEAVAVEALASLTRAADSTDIADPRKAVVLYQCRDCGRSELETGPGATTLSEAAAARLGESAKRVDLATEGKAEVRRGGALPAAIRRAVLARDRGRCRLCGRRRYVDVHHLRAQSEGGEHSRDNCACLCTGCHAAVHEGAVRIEGSAEAGLRWYAPDGEPRGGDEGPGLSNESSPQPELSELARRVLRTMGGRGGWYKDELCERGALRASEASRGVMELELAGLVTSDVYSGRLSPTAKALGKSPATDEWAETPLWGAAAPAEPLGASDCRQTPTWDPAGSGSSGSSWSHDPSAHELARGSRAA